MSDAPPHRRPELIALVVVGGAAGTAARAALQSAFPAASGVSIATIAINVSGAFVLGWLLEALARRGPDVGRRRLVRLGIGTGVLGGYTTYSTLAVDTSSLLIGGHAAEAAFVGLGTVLGGLIAAVAGIALAARTAPAVA